MSEKEKELLEEEPVIETEAAEAETEAAEEQAEPLTAEQQQIADLQAELDKARKQSDDFLDRLRRTMAEFDNFRKRTQSEKSGIYANAVSDTLSGLLPIIDNLQYAAKYSGGDAEKVAEGLTMILSKLPETLEKLGIKAFGEAGETFDPALHNAVMHVEDEEHGEGDIVEVLQQGYMYGDKVLRYAMVKTAN